MGSGTNKLRVRGEFDDKISSPLDKLRDRFDQLGKSKGAKSILQGVGMGAGVAAFGLLGRGIGAVVDIAGDSIRAASDLNETLSKSSVIFGDNADEVAAWGKTMAAAGGLSQKAALDAASGFAGLFQTVGLAADKSADMAKTLTTMGSDLASFFNTDVDTALAALKSGLSGQSEPLRQFNVFLSETAVSAKLAQMGIKKVGGQFTESQKATARYALIMEQTTTAQGDFVRTSDGLANSQRTLQAELENLSAEVGQELLPVVLELAHFAKDVLVPALRETFGAFKTLGTGIDFLLGPMGSLGKQGDAVTLTIENNTNAATVATAAWGTYGQAAMDASGQTAGLASAAKETTGEVKNLAREHQFAGDAIDTAATAMEGAGDAAKDSRAKISPLARKVADLADGFKDLDKWAKTAGDTLASAAYGPEELRLAFEGSRLELIDNQRELTKLTDEFVAMEAKGKKPTLEQKQHMNDLQSAVNDGKQEVIKLGTQLQITGGMSMSALRTQFAKLGINIDNVKGDAASLWRYLQLINNTNLGTGVYAGRIGGRAEGGPVFPGQTYRVGEQGEETLVMGRTGGYVIPHASGGGSSSGGGAPVVLQLNLDGRTIAQVVDRELYYLRRTAPGAMPGVR